MCDYCNERELCLLIESEKLDDHLIGLDPTMLATTLLNFVDDNSVVINIRNGRGYIRLGDRDDMQCLDHEQKIEIYYCPMCGRKLMED
jgi:hypothetical protein